MGENKCFPDRYGLVYASFAIIFLTLFFVFPLFIVIIFSFLKSDSNVGVLPELSFNAYRILLRLDYGNAIVNTIIITLFSSFIAVFIALPCAYYMAISHRQTLLLLLITVPFWTNFLVRVFAWKAILEANGFLNLLLMKFGIVDVPIIFLYNRLAVIIVLAYTYLPFAILPLYGTIERFDFSLLEAGQDLGCTHMRSLVKIMLPNIRTGILTAIMFVFIPILGQYVIPELVGGGREGTFMIGQKMANAFFKERNWPVPAAFSTVLIGITLCLLIYQKVRGKGKKHSRIKMSKLSPIQVIF